MPKDPKDPPKDPKNAALCVRRKEDPDKKAHGDCRDCINALLADWAAGTELMRVGCCLIGLHIGEACDIEFGLDNLHVLPDGNSRVNPEHFPCETEVGLGAGS